MSVDPPVDQTSGADDEPASSWEAVPQPRRGNDKISVGSGDEKVAKLQLAARWAETYASAAGDSFDAMLRRFNRAYTYIDAVTHGIEPEDHPGEAAVNPQAMSPDDERIAER